MLCGELGKITLFVPLIPEISPEIRAFGLERL
jgi:hypothetical protein